MHTKQIIALGCLMAGLAVALGAFGSHALKPILVAVGKADVFETANKYHFYHSLGIILVGILAEKSAKITGSAYCFLIGILCFSGSLYTLALTGMTFLGAVAPIGGSAFMIGWGILAYQFVKLK